MFKKFHNRRAQSTLELVTMIVILIVTILAFRKYIVRAIDARYKTAGDSFGYGRQYDPKTTLTCKFDYEYTQTWYSEECFENDPACHCGKLTSNQQTCQQCIINCGDIWVEEIQGNRRICDE